MLRSFNPQPEPLIRLPHPNLPRNLLDIPILYISYSPIDSSSQALAVFRAALGFVAARCPRGLLPVSIQRPSASN